LKKRLTTLALTAVFALLPAAIAADGFTDVAGHWGEEHLTRLIEAGVIVGDGRGRAMPERPVALYEADVMLSKVFGYDMTGMEIDRPLPLRQDALAIIRNAFRLPDAPPSFRSKFTDFYDVSEGLRGAVGALEYAGLISGRRGKIAPRDTITRAEFAALLSKSICAFIDEDTDFKGAELARAVVRRADITVKNLTAEYLFIAEADNVTLEGCDLGTIFILGNEGSLRLVKTNVTELFSAESVSISTDGGSIIEQPTPRWP
jgi:hypothetical protein